MALNVGTDTPFCGTASSQSATANRVMKGECGKCQVQLHGGGGESICARGPSNKDVSCPDTNSCGNNSVCCPSGQCAPILLTGDRGYACDKLASGECISDTS